MSGRIREKFENRKDCYSLEGTVFRETSEPWAGTKLPIMANRPAAEFERIEDQNGLWH